MGHKPWDMPERRAARRRGNQQWRGDIDDELPEDTRPDDLPTVTPSA